MMTLKELRLKAGILHEELQKTVAEQDRTLIKIILDTFVEERDFNLDFDNEEVFQDLMYIRALLESREQELSTGIANLEEKLHSSIHYDKAVEVKK